ncbi:hypothetical protein J6590_067731 [Homalodisca vitripennis]|nr:hypothetical protein J6590_067731 [Homalodisca vitripennis]
MTHQHPYMPSSLPAPTKPVHNISHVTAHEDPSRTEEALVTVVKKKKWINKARGRKNTRSKVSKKNSASDTSRYTFIPDSCRGGRLPRPRIECEQAGLCKPEAVCWMSGLHLVTTSRPLSRADGRVRPQPQQPRSRHRLPAAWSFFDNSSIGRQRYTPHGLHLQANRKLLPPLNQVLTYGRLYHQPCPPRCSSSRMMRPPHSHPAPLSTPSWPTPSSDL